MNVLASNEWPKISSISIASQCYLTSSAAKYRRDSVEGTYCDCNVAIKT